MSGIERLHKKWKTSLKSKLHTKFYSATQDEAFYENSERLRLTIFVKSLILDGLLSSATSGFCPYYFFVDKT